jgi:PKD repeat protein
MKFSKQFSFITAVFCLFFLFIFNAIPETANDWQPICSLNQTTKVDINRSQQVLIRTMDAGNDLLQFQYQIPDPVVTETAYSLTDQEISAHHLTQFSRQIWHSLQLADLPLKSAIGIPELPFIPAKFIVPQGYRIRNIEIDLGQEYRFNQPILLEPGEEPYPLLPGTIPNKTLPNTNYYQTDQFSPSCAYELVGISGYRGLKVLQLNIFPLKYNPVSREIIFYKDLTLTIHTTRNSTENDDFELKYWPNETEKLFLHGVENPDAATSYQPDPAFRQTYKLLIITNSTIANATGTNSIQDFKTHKISKGISTTIETIESIYSSTSGTDNAEKLRNHIKARYNEWGIEYVLLVGDTTIIPYRSLYCISWEGEGNYTDHIPSDLYFSCLDGNYNHDGDTNWGEPNDGVNGLDVDLIMDVAVGRATVDTTANVTAWVKKTKQFDNADPNSAYKKKLLMIGEHLGFGGIAEYAKPHLMDIINGSSEYGFTTAGFAADPAFSYEGLFDMDGTWQSGTLKTKLNSNQFGFVNHLGHANSNYVMKMVPTDITALTNSTSFFVYSQGCYAGSFDTDTCIGEYFTTNADNAAFASVFNSRYGWGRLNTKDGQSGRFNREFWDAVFGEHYSQLGDIFADQKHDLSHRITEPCMRWCYYEINLFGDPTVSLRDKVRADFSYTKNNLTFNFSDKSFTPSGSITQWQWNFGNGSNSTQQNPSITFGSEGYYDVTLSVQTSTGLSHAKTQRVYAGSNHPPIPLFVHYQNGSEVEFYDYSNDIDGFVTGYQWNFGDGTASTLKDPVHSYSSQGTFTVIHTVTDNLGKSDSVTKVIEVTSAYCESKSSYYNYVHVTKVGLGTMSKTSAGSTYSDYTTSVAPAKLTADQTYTLAITINSAQYQNGFKAYIDYDQDGNFTDSGEIVYNSNGAISGSSVSKSITIPKSAKSGLTRLRVQVKNGGEPTPCETFQHGEVEDYTVEIINNCTPPTANFTWQIDDTNPFLVEFTDLSTDSDGDAITQWDWKFGDGWFSTLQNPIYDYKTAGTFPVSLTVSNSCGKTSSIQKTIELIDNNECVYDHLVGSFPGIGIWMRDSETTAWTQLSKQQADIIRVGDINGNGLDDIAAYFKTTKKLWYRYDNGIWEDIQASAATLLVFDLGDMNDDGKEDLVGGWTDKGLWWRNSANGVWTKISNMVPDLVAAADFNGDNKADIVGKFPSLNSIWIYYSNNTWKQISKQVNLVDLRAGNMDNDAEAELVGSWDIGVWMFDPATNNWVKHHNDQAKQITVGDINAQCMQDIVGYWSTATPLYVKFMENNTWQKLSNYNPDTMDAGKVK